MELQELPYDLSVCKVRELRANDISADFFFVGKTDEELSLVCETRLAPEDVLEREDGWRAFRIQGVLDFSLVGVLAPIADVLAENEIGIFVVSTFNTDYVLVKRDQFERALDLLACAGYTVVAEPS